MVLPQFNSEGRLQDIGKIDPYSKYSQYNRKKHKKEVNITNLIKI